MKIFDCFMYFNEDLILDIRLHELYNKIDKFVIVESKHTHSGITKGYNFDINKFKKFSDKIEYIQIDENPKNLFLINAADDEITKCHKEIQNALLIENFQRNCLDRGLNSAENEDIILISDLDEIPNLENVNFKKNINKIILFKQYFFQYRFDLFLDNFFFFGSKACSKKNFLSPQWLRNIKNKKYEFYRLDTYFSKKKYTNIHIVEKGGWHFTNIMSPEKLEYKLRSYLHHGEIPRNITERTFLEKMIKEREINYDHAADKRSERYTKKKLSFFNKELLPKYIKDNLIKFDNWFYKN